MRVTKVLKSLGVAALLVTCTAWRASAQIYSWRDSAGNLVLSDRRPSNAAGATSYEVPASEGVRATRFVNPRRSEAYNDLIIEHARRNHVRQSLVRAVIQVESAFNPTARSVKGAMGLMQLMPQTAREFGVTNPFNPEDNVRGGVAYLRQLLDRYDNNEELALAAYNAGPGAVDKHGQRVPPFPETRDYVWRVNQIAGRARAAASGLEVYKTIEIVDGRAIVKYSDKKPE